MEHTKNPGAPAVDNQNVNSTTQDATQAQENAQAQELIEVLTAELGKDKIHGNEEPGSSTTTVGNAIGLGITTAVPMSNALGMMQANAPAMEQLFSRISEIDATSPFTQAQPSSSPQNQTPVNSINNQGAISAIVPNAHTDPAAASARPQLLLSNPRPTAIKPGFTEHRLWWNMLGTDDRALFYRFINRFPESTSLLHFRVPFRGTLFDASAVSRPQRTRIGRLRREDGTFEDCLEPIPPTKYVPTILFNQEVTLEYPGNFLIENEEDKDSAKDILLFCQILTRKNPRGWDNKDPKARSCQVEYGKTPTLWEYSIYLRADFNDRPVELKRFVQMDQFVGQSPPSWEDAVKVLKGEMWHWMNSLLQHIRQQPHNQPPGPATHTASQQRSSQMPPPQSAAPNTNVTFTARGQGTRPRPATTSRQAVPPDISVVPIQSQILPGPGPQVPYTSPYRQQLMQQNGASGFGILTPDPLALPSYQGSTAARGVAPRVNSQRRESAGLSNLDSMPELPKQSGSMNTAPQQVQKRKVEDLSGRTLDRSASQETMHSANRPTLSAQNPSTPGMQQRPTSNNNSEYPQSYANGSNNIQQFHSRRNKEATFQQSTSGREDTMRKLNTIEQELNKPGSQDTESFRSKGEQNMIQQWVDSLETSSNSLQRDFRRVPRSESSVQQNREVDPRSQIGHHQAGSSIQPNGVAQPYIQSVSGLGRPNMTGQQIQNANLAQQQHHTDRSKVIPGTYPSQDKQKGMQFGNQPWVDVQHGSEASGRSPTSQSEQETPRSMYHGPQNTVPSPMQNQMHSSQWQRHPQFNPDGGHQSQPLMQSTPSQMQTDATQKIHWPSLLNQVPMNGSGGQYFLTPQQMANCQTQYSSHNSQYGQLPQIPPQYNPASAHRGTGDGLHGPSWNQVFGPNMSYQASSPSPNQQYRAPSLHPGNQNRVNGSNCASPPHPSESYFPASHAHGQSPNLGAPIPMNGYLQSGGLAMPNNRGFSDADHQRVRGQVENNIMQGRSVPNLERQFANSGHSPGVNQMNEFQTIEDVGKKEGI